MTRRRILFISIPIFILLCGIAGFLFVRSDYFLDNFVKYRLIQAIQEQFNNDYQVSIKKLHGNILTGVEVVNLDVQEVGSNTEPILSTKKVVFKYNIFALLRRKLLVKALEVDKLRINIVRDSDGKLNLTHLLQKNTAEPKQETKNTFAFAVADIYIKQGNVQISDAQQNIELSLPDIRFDLDGELESWEHTGRFSIGKGDFTINETMIPIEQLVDMNFAISTTGSGLSEPFRLQLGNSLLVINEFERAWDKGNWETLIELTIDGQDVQKIIQNNTELDGLCRIIFDLNGTNSTIYGKIVGKSEALSIRQISLPKDDNSESFTRKVDLTDIVIDSTVDFNVDHKITINEFGARTAEGKLSGTGVLTFDQNAEGNLFSRLQHYIKQPISYNSTLKLSDVQLPYLISMFVEMSDEMQNFSSGTFNGLTEITGNSTGNFHIDAEVNLLDTSIAVHDKEQEKYYSLTDSSLKCVITSVEGSDSTVIANGIIDDTKVEISGSLNSIDIKLNNINFGKLSNISKSGLLSGYGNLSAIISKDGTLIGTVEIPRAYYGNSNNLLGELTGNLMYKDKVLYIENGQLKKESNNEDTNISINGNVKLTSKLPTNFTINSNSLVLDSEYNQIFFQQAHPINGKIKGQLRLFGSLIDNLDGEGKFTVESGNAWGINLDPATFLLEIDDYSLSIPDFEITTQGQQVIMNVNVSNNGEFDLTLKNRKNKPIQITKLALAAGTTDFPLDGKMYVSIRSFQKKQEDVVFQVDLQFKDLSFQNNPLGDAVMQGFLVDIKDNTDEPDYFNFTGEAFEGTSIINGKIFTTQDSPYQFTMQSEHIPVSPILRIFDRRLEAISGTADGKVEVVGTITDLVEPDRSPKALNFPYNVDIIINKSQLQYNSIDFSNPKQIKMKLEDDILTIVESSLNFKGQNTPFLELIGTFDTKNEIIDISTETDQVFPLKPIGLAFGQPIDGIVSYQLTAKGSLSEPNIELRWKLPKLSIHTNVGDIHIQNANGELTYSNSKINFAPMSMQLLNNIVSINGNVDVDKMRLENSKLNFDISSNGIELVEFSDIIKNCMSDDLFHQYTRSGKAIISGLVETKIHIGGSVVQPIISVNAHTTANNPIKFGPISKPIKLDEFSAKSIIKQRNILIQDVVFNGKMDDGIFQIDGETSLSTINTDDMEFTIGVSVNNLDINEFTKLVQKNAIFDKALISGSVDFSGTGIKPHLITAIGLIDELKFYIYNYKIENKTRIRLNIKQDGIQTYIPLSIISPEIDTNVDITVGGLLSNPDFSINWQGSINSPLQVESDVPLLWNGSVNYDNNLITFNTRLTNNGDNLNLIGKIPFILSIRDNDTLAQFTETPIDIQLTGNELPLEFFPGLENVLSKVDGVVDLDLKIQGVFPKLYLQGTTSIKAPYIAIQNIPQPLENVKLQINAQQDIIEFTKFQFEMDDGLVMLQQKQPSLLILEGLTPKKLEVNDLSLHKYPYSSLLQQSINSGIISDFDGEISATLRKLSIPLNSYFENSDKYPLPKYSELISFESVIQNVEADFTVDKLFSGFTLLDERYYFENPQPIPILLNSGEFTIKELKLINTLNTEQNFMTTPLTFSSYGKWNMGSEMLLNISLDNFDLATLNSLFSDINLDTYKLNGLISTDINITGTYSDPDITVSLDGEMIKLNNAHIDDFSGDINYISEDRKWAITKSNPIQLIAGNNQLNISGTVPYMLSFTNLVAEPLNEPMEVLFALKLDDIGILSVIEPQIDSADGTGSISATVHGTPFDPLLTGVCEFNLESLILDDSPVFFNDTQGQFIFSESELRIQSINGQLNEGSFRASGNIDTVWFNINRVNIDASLDNCNFAEPGQYLANVSTGVNNLHLYGNVGDVQPNNLTLSGDVVIHSGNYEQNWENVRDWFSGGTVSSVELIFDNTFLDNLQLDLMIDIPEDFHFLSSLGGTTDIEITCNGRLTGLIQEPIFSGEVTILKGKISIVTQEFEIVEGSRITNQDETTFNPKLDIILKTPNPIRGVLLEDGSTADLNVTATVTGILENGDIDKARLGFQVDPINSSTTTVFSDAYVLSLLLPGSSISRSFGGITFTISSGFDPNERHIIAEYPLPKNMSIKVEGDERGDFGVDVQLLERRF